MYIIRREFTGWNSSLFWVTYFWALRSVYKNPSTILRPVRSPSHVCYTPSTCIWVSKMYKILNIIMNSDLHSTKLFYTFITRPRWPLSPRNAPRHVIVFSSFVKLFISFTKATQPKLTWPISHKFKNTNYQIL